MLSRKNSQFLYSKAMRKLTYVKLSYENFLLCYRTAINSQSGVRTPAGGLWTGALVIVAIVVLTPYFAYIPEAVLAAVIIAAVIQMVEYEVVLTLWRVKSKSKSNTYADH